MQLVNMTLVYIMIGFPIKSNTLRFVTVINVTEKKNEDVITYVTRQRYQGRDLQ